VVQRKAVRRGLSFEAASTIPACGWGRIVHAAAGAGLRRHGLRTRSAFAGFGAVAFLEDGRASRKSWTNQPVSLAPVRDDTAERLSRARKVAIIFPTKPRGQRGALAHGTPLRACGC